ncbi:10946_t:CDS:1, partial [Funneliformis mosseae]
RTHIPYGECNTLTASFYGMCMKYAGKYYNKANYHKNKLQDKKCDQASWVIQKYV